MRGVVIPVGLVLGICVALAAWHHSWTFTALSLLILTITSRK